MRWCLLLVVASSACTPLTREEWLTDVARRSEGLCWWREARWDDRGTLLVRGTGEPFAHARARWAGDTWQGSTITGVLRRAGPLVLLQGQWTGPGLTLIGDVDVASQAVFRSFEPVRVGSAGLLLKGGHVRVSDAAMGRTLVVPAEESLRPFRADQAVALELGCEALSLSANPPPAGDLARRLLALSGFPENAPERWVPENVSLPAAASAGGATVGRFVAEDVPVRGFAVEQKADETRLVVPTRAGLVWVGWVASEGLQAPQGAPPEPVLPREIPPTAAAEWRSCDDELPLHLESRGKIIEVGTLKAATPFTVVARRGDYREVRVAVEWLELEPEARLLVPERAKLCPHLRQLGAW